MTDTSLAGSARPASLRTFRRVGSASLHLARPARAAGLPLLLAFVAACTPATAPSASPGASGAPSAPPTGSPNPTSTPVTGGISHPTGATDVVLRVESGGGFSPIEFIATSAPSFTLYGDGTVVFRDPNATPPDPVGGVTPTVPFQTVRLGEEGIQALLEDALGPGALGIATGPYIGLGADIPTTTFTINADGKSKDVSVSGFLPDMHPGDAVIIAALGKLAERLDGFGARIAGEEAYVPTAYRGVLMAVDQPFGPVIAWPWSDIQPTDFVTGDNEFLMTRSMTPAEIAEIGIPGIEGGSQGPFFQTAGKAYWFALRPLLPDETAGPTLN